MNESRTDESCQPPWARKPSMPRETRNADADRDQRRQRRQRGAVDEQQDDHDQEDRDQRRAVGAVLDGLQVVATDARPGR